MNANWKQLKNKFKNGITFEMQELHFIAGDKADNYLNNSTSILYDYVHNTNLYENSIDKETEHAIAIDLDDGIERFLFDSDTSNNYDYIRLFIENVYLSEGYKKEEIDQIFEDS